MNITKAYVIFFLVIILTNSLSNVLASSGLLFFSNYFKVILKQLLNILVFLSKIVKPI
ncbi:hypothetical protein AtEden1_Chr2g0224781 [Arabidopsis thaliana]